VAHGPPAAVLVRWCPVRGHTMLTAGDGRCRPRLASTSAASRRPQSGAHLAHLRRLVPATYPHRRRWRNQATRPSPGSGHLRSPSPA
jgi:hypothetical protein